MDGKKQMGSSSSSSSFTTDLFGSTESSASSSSSIFASIFDPSSKVFGRESLRSEAVGMKQDSTNQVWNPKPGSQEKTPWSSGGENESVPNKDSNPYYQEQRVQPCGLSSSIYYGGQDVYSYPQKTQLSGYSTVSLSIMKGEKMIRALLQEEIGGKGLYITKSQPPLACEFTLHYTYRIERKPKSARIRWIPTVATLQLVVNDVGTFTGDKDSVFNPRMLQAISSTNVFVTIPTIAFVLMVVDQAKAKAEVSQDTLDPMKGCPDASLCRDLYDEAIGVLDTMEQVFQVKPGMLN
ncbi:hypothetical protein RHSIM_Rhsim04G0163100 [Rhododendron simsii]|uniref:Uncharacterized protein n=1 Tax=Rhododendron simsii TaxID=118357 RepID=A0A834GYI9_RHOSS|nr:hypothetical protein RHSIM_Rhsim04G0163100 [Rhododendron simsii]